MTMTIIYPVHYLCPEECRLLECRRLTGRESWRLYHSIIVLWKCHRRNTIAMIVNTQSDQSQLTGIVAVTTKEKGVCLPP